MTDTSAPPPESLRPPGPRYTFKADRFSSHAAMARVVQERARRVADEPYVVLDLGCAAGFLRPYLPAPRFYLIGMEIDEQAADQARRTYDEVHVADIGTVLSAPLPRRVHTIVFGDSLEHVADPLRTLRSVRQNLGEQPVQVVISVPNVAHLYVRLNLLLGRFDYADRGILDRTHLRFFTLHTAKRLIVESGFSLRSVSTTPVPLPLLHPSFGEGRTLFPLHRVNHLLARTFKTSLAYQFILEAEHASG